MTKVKKIKKFGIGKFIVIALVLGGGLVYGTQMVQKNQDNRSNAMKPGSACKCSNPKYGSVSSCVKGKGKWICPLATTPTAKPTVVSKKCSLTKCGDCTSASTCGNAGCYWETTVKICTNKSVSPKIDGVCGDGNNSCVMGDLKDSPDSDTQYIWSCVGKNGGISINCNTNKLKIIEAGANCTYNGTFLWDGSLKCVDSRIGSQKILCNNGKISVVGVYFFSKYCENECSMEGVRSCSPDGNDVIVCNKNYRWLVDEKCVYGCAVGSCNDCFEGAESCSGDTTIICKYGEWSSGEKCLYGCTNGKCNTTPKITL